MSFFKQLYDNFEEGACALFVAVMVLCLFLQVAMRIAVGSSLAWTEELSRYSFLWAVYVGAALAVKRGGHVRITAQFMFLPTRWRLVFRAVGDIIWIGFSLYVAWIGLACIEEGLYYPEVSPTLGVVKAWVECIIPFSFENLLCCIVNYTDLNLKTNKICIWICFRHARNESSLTSA